MQSFVYLNLDRESKWPKSRIIDSDDSQLAKHSAAVRCTSGGSRPIYLGGPASSFRHVVISVISVHHGVTS